jgi:anti-sigma B factor antagonist
MSVTSDAQFRVRHPNSGVAVIDISGDLTAKSELGLMGAYQQAAIDGVSSIILCFTELQYMNSSGIGLLVTLLIRGKRNGQRLLAFGLSDHYRQIFDVTRLAEAIQIFGSEAEAIAATGISHVD